MNQDEQFQAAMEYDFASLLFTPDKKSEWPSALPHDGYYGFYLLFKYLGYMMRSVFRTNEDISGYDHYLSLAQSYLESGTIHVRSNQFKRSPSYMYLSTLFFVGYLEKFPYLSAEELTEAYRDCSAIISAVEKSHQSANLLRSADLCLAKKYTRLLLLFLYVHHDETNPCFSDYSWQKELNLIKRRGIPTPYLQWMEYYVRFEKYNYSNKFGKMILLSEEWENQASRYPHIHSPFLFNLRSLESMYLKGEHIMALEWLELLRMRNPGNAEFVKWELRFLRENNRLEEAKDLCLRMMKRFRDDDIYCIASNIAFLMREYENARKYSRLALEIDENKCSSHVALGYATMFLDDPQAALLSFDIALTMEPHHSDAIRGKAKALFMIGNTFAALKYLQTAFRADPRSAEICYELADMYFMAGYMKECKKYCLRCIDLDKEYSDAYILLGMLDCRAAKDESAARWLHKALEIDPTNPIALNELAYLEHLAGNDETAISLLDTALAIEPDYSDAMCGLGVIYFYQSRFEEAQDMYDKVIELDPCHVGALTGKGNLHLALSEPEEALQWFDEALEEEPYYSEAIQGKITAYRSMGLEQEAFEWTEKMKDIDEG